MVYYVIDKDHEMNVVCLAEPASAKQKTLD